MKEIVVLGAGFAGLWAAIGAQRKLSEIGAEAAAKVTVVNRTPYHNIRVRNYEADLSEVRVPLCDVLDPVGIKWMVGNVVGLDVDSQSIVVDSADERSSMRYDRLVVALGSHVDLPPVPGLAEFGFNVDTYEAAKTLGDHLASLSSLAGEEGCATVVVVGAGPTGLEVATGMPPRLTAIFNTLPARSRVILVDSSLRPAGGFVNEAQDAVAKALAEAGIELRSGATIASVAEGVVVLSTGERIPTRTLIWCAGMRANPIVEALPVQRDRFDRIFVDEYLQLREVKSVFAAGDVASAQVDADHASVMSCQHARPMGRLAGHNVVADLYGLPMIPFRVNWYVTVVDLGAWGALYTKGFDHQLLISGQKAKAIKTTINRHRIYPPRTGLPADILAAAAPVIDSPPWQATGGANTQMDSA